MEKDVPGRRAGKAWSVTAGLCGRGCRAGQRQDEGVRSDPGEEGGVTERWSKHQLSTLSLESSRGPAASHWRVLGRNQVRQRLYIFTFAVPINYTQSPEHLSLRWGRQPGINAFLLRGKTN